MELQPPDHAHSRREARARHHALSGPRTDSDERPRRSRYGRRRMKRIACGSIAMLVALGLYLRLQYKWVDNPPDSFAYMAGSLELLEHGRYGLRAHNWCRATELKETYASCRLPGYSLVLSAIRPGAHSYDDFYSAAKIANALFDVITALACAWLLWAMSRGAAVAAVAAVMLHPFPIRLSAAVLSESVSMMLASVIVLLLVRFAEAAKRAQWAIGLLLVLAVLVRPDALTLVPLAVLAVWQMTGRARLTAIARMVAPVVIVLLAWGARNHARIGSFSPLGTICDLCGQSTQAGVARWVGTWIRSEESVPVMWALAEPRQPKAHQSIPKFAYASDAERAAITALFEPVRVPQAQIDATLATLASSRPLSARLAQFTWVPLWRAALLWWHRPTFLVAPNPFKREAPLLLRVAAEQMQVLSALLLIAAAVGLWRVRRADPALRRLVFFCGAAIVLRTGALAVMGLVEQRYVIEVWPLLVCIAASAVRRAAPAVSPVT